MPLVRLAIAGVGAVGLKVASRIDAGDIPGIALKAVSARDPDKASAKLAGFTSKPKLISLAALADEADVIIECLPAKLFPDVAEPAIRRGRILIPLSVGALLGHMHLIDLARATGARIIVPSGAILGLDAVRAAAEGEIHSVRLISRKPPAGWQGAPYLVENGISVDGIAEPMLIFMGTAAEAAKAFPANLNISAALSLAGIGADKTAVEVWADPTIGRNTHTVEVRSDSSNLTMTIANIPTPENPRTGLITALSVMATLRRLVSPLVVGT